MLDGDVLADALGLDPEFMADDDMEDAADEAEDEVEGVDGEAEGVVELLQQQGKFLTIVSTNNHSCLSGQCTCATLTLLLLSTNNQTFASSSAASYLIKCTHPILINTLMTMANL